MPTASLPVIDIENADDIYLALAETGFFYVTEHGVSPQLIKSLQSEAQQFFKESDQFKQQIDMRKSGDAWRGYFPLGSELTSGQPDQKEGLYFGSEDSHHDFPLHGQNLWPCGKKYINFKRNVLTYMASMNDLGSRLMQQIAVGLELPQDYFSQRFTKQPTTLFRIFNYPLTNTQQWGVREHTDMGFLTLLLQDENYGLEVKTHTGAWVPLPPIENTFVVNIGDMLELWTRGIFRATPHRVKNQGKVDRLSFPYFYDPNWTSTLEPIDRKRLNGLDKVTRTPRWDELDLSKLPEELTYGEYVWDKVQKVFPKE